ncbi:uncharacterized protein si:ch73-43g23.1 [Carcharodon carcharias]|uniref:uncharacterized protein si:ch73-43g23.1 n=1 Tax=Carcharodon carcharias TaxID=13397 RepID=UPI001B7E88CC|nr:uncharacterized protein si:ch73-43g23.1 [Carcharodon carcharias]XP_041050520.1 uncharacterized protein si:ch73-43g23.1 [Carcharodon carcharias]
MNCFDEVLPFVENPPAYNRRDEPEVGSKFISEVWSNNLSNNSNTDLSFISENTTRTESFNQVLTESCNLPKVNTIPIGHSTDPDSINNDQLPEHGDFISTVKMLSGSPLFSKADDAPCDSSGSYHTAICSESLENLSDCSGTFEEIEELPIDNDENQDVSESGRSQILADSQKEQNSDLLNRSKNENSLNVCSMALQSYHCEGQEQIFVNTHKTELCGLNAKEEACELNGQLKLCRLESKNEPDVNSHHKKDKRAIVTSVDEKKPFEYETTSGPQEDKSVCCSVVVSDDTLLTTNRKSCTQEIASKSTEYDLSVRGTDIKNCKGNGDQQVQLSITAQNSKTGEGSSTVQLTKIQKTGVSRHESPGCNLQPGFNEPEEMFQIDTFENGFKNNSCLNGKIYADCVSETSSAASELDETDYEVQKLTALAFRSLSCLNDDYLDIYNSRAFIDFSSPLSEEIHKTNRLSTCIGLDYTGVFDSNECSDSSNTACALHAEAEEGNMVLLDDSLDRVQCECVDVVVETQDKSKDFRTSRTVPKRQIELRKRQRSELKVFTSRGAINSCVCVDPAVETENNEETSEHLQNCENMPHVENANMKDEDSIDKQLQRATSTDGPLTKNKFASYLLTNVISKKMQFEQGLKMEQELDKNTNSAISPTFVKKEDFDVPTIVSQQIQLEGSTSKSEPVNFTQGNFGKNSCELNDTNIEENRNVGQKHSCLECEGGLNWDGKKNTNTLNCCGTNVSRNWSESNTDSQNEPMADTTFELNPEKPCPMLHDLSTNASKQEKNMNAPRVSEGKHTDYISQATEEKMTLNDRMQSEQTPYEDRTSDIQSGNISCKINAPSNILVLKSPEMLHNSQLTNVKQTIPFCIAKEISPTMDSNTHGLDLLHQVLPTSFKLESKLEQEKVSQPNIKDNITIKNKTKDLPYHVRDVRKLVQNTCSALTFCTAKAKSDVPEEVHSPSSFEQSFSETQHKPSPIFIQCQSISRKAAKDDNSYSTVDKKYWTCTGNSDASRIFSSDFQLPIPSNKQKSQVISAKRIGCKNYSIKENANDHLTCLTCEVTSERKIQALSISNNQESGLSFMKVQLGLENQKNCSTNFALNSEIADLVPGKGKQTSEFQVGLENINTHLSNSTTTTEDSEISISKLKLNRDINRELENENEFSTKSNSNNEDISMAFDKNEPRGAIPDRTQDKTTLLKHSPLNRNMDPSKRKHEPKKGVQAKLEVQNNQLGIFNYKNEHVELSHEKNYPQNDIQVNLKNQNGLFHNSDISNKDLSCWKGDPNNDIKMRLENQNKCLRISTSNDKETQTLPRKGKHKKEIQFRLEKQNKMSETLTLDNEEAILSCEKHELESELQVSLEAQNKLFENSTLNVESTNLLLDDSKGRIKLDQDNHSALVLKTEDNNILPDVNKHKNEMQIGLQDEAKPLYDSSSNSKLSPINCNLKGEIHEVMEDQNNLLSHCTQNKNKNKEEFKIEHNSQKDTGKVEIIPTTEKVGLTFISKLLPFKDNNTISMVSEEERKSATEDCSESRNSEVVDEQLSSVQVQLPNDTNLIPVNTREKSAVSVESSNCPETINISSKNSLQETETHGDVHGKSTFSSDIHNATVNNLMASQPTLTFTNFNVKLLDSMKPDVKLSTKSIGDQAKQQPLEMKTVAMCKASTQEEASVTSDRVNYLTIPTKEHKPEASPQIQIPASLQPVIPKPGHCSTTASPHQQNWEILDPDKQEQQAFPSTGQTPNVVEKCYMVPQSPHFIANPQFPCFQYSLVDKKMLIDPETGKHYFVEASVQSPRKMLLDPETGCYVEIIIPEQTYCAAPFSPYVLYPNALRPSYIPRMQYSNLLPPPLVTYSDPSPEPPEAQMQSNLNGTIEKQNHKNNTQKNQLAGSNYMESAYYIPTGVSTNPNPAQTSMEVICTCSKPCVEVKNNSTVILSPQQI